MAELGNDTQQLSSQYTIPAYKDSTKLQPISCEEYSLGHSLSGDASGLSNLVPARSQALQLHLSTTAPSQDFPA